MSAFPWSETELSFGIATESERKQMTDFLVRIAPADQGDQAMRTGHALVNLYQAEWTLHNKVVCIANDHPAVLYSQLLSRRMYGGSRA